MNEYTSSPKFCRVCLEESDIMNMISPCSCRGTSLMIHKKCLESWQELSIERNMMHFALICPTCHSYYNYPSIYIQIYRIFTHIISAQLKDCTTWMLRILWSSFVVFKVMCYLFLTICLLFLNSQIVIFGNYAIAALKDNGILQLALIHSTGFSTDEDQTIVGQLVTATDYIHNSSIFSKTSILLFEHNNGRTRGLIINNTTQVMNEDNSIRSHVYVNEDILVHSTHIDHVIATNNTVASQPLSTATTTNITTTNNNVSTSSNSSSNNNDTTLHRQQESKNISTFYYGGPVSKYRIFVLCNDYHSIYISKSRYIYSFYIESIKQDMYVGEYDEVHWLYMKKLLHTRTPVSPTCTSAVTENTNIPNTQSTTSNTTSSPLILRIYRGCVSWLPGQLEGELLHGVWKIKDMKEDLFNTLYTI